MAERTIIKRSIADCFEKFMKQGRVLFFSAPCGFGKTCVADALTEGKSVLRLSAADPDFVVPSKAGSWRILLIDDLQNLQEDEEWLPLRDLIRDCPDRRFLLLSRGAPNGTLMAFQYSGLMTVLESKAFLFEREDVRRLLESWEISASDADISGIYKESIGHPLGVVVTARRMAQGARSPWSWWENASRRSSGILKRPYTGGLTCPFSVFCWSLLPLSPSIWTWPVL